MVQIRVLRGVASKDLYAKFKGGVRTSERLPWIQPGMLLTVNCIILWHTYRHPLDVIGRYSLLVPERERERDAK